MMVKVEIVAEASSPLPRDKDILLDYFGERRVGSRILLFLSFSLSHERLPHSVGNRYKGIAVPSTRLVIQLKLREPGL